MQVIEQADYVVHHLDAIVAGVVGFATTPVAAAIDGDDAITAGELSRNRIPRFCGRRKAMDENYRFACPVHHVANRHAIRIEG